MLDRRVAYKKNSFWTKIDGGRKNKMPSVTGFPFFNLHNNQNHPYFIISVEGQFLQIPELLELSPVELITLLRAPAIMRFVQSHSRVKKWQRKDGSLLMGL